MSAIGKTGATATRLKRSRASLVGGVATGLGVLILVLLLAGSASALNVTIGLALAIAVAAWVRLADL
jgi:hypothetical protein